MKRRDFLKKSALFSGAFALNNIPVQTMAKSNFLNQMAMTSDNDKVLVIVQLHGGNDGLNTLIPIGQYTEYQNIRPNIALPFSGSGSRNIINLDPSLDIADQVGIHPDMGDLRYLYDEGKVKIIRDVAYDNMDQSHFRSRDIFFMGGGHDDYYDSGWLGRYLVEKYPGYPDNYPNEEMPDPLSLEIGNGISLAFHTPNTIPASLSISNPQQFYNLINGVIGSEGVPEGLDGSIATPPEAITTTKYAEEVRWIMEFEQKSDGYAERLRDVYLAGSNSANVSYPEQYPFTAPSGARSNPLSGQLQLISRLLSGGVKTKVFLARIGGFDTHAFQVDPSSTTYGSHAAKLYHVFSAIRAFQDDLKDQGLEDRVLTVTLSEFGRRAASNNSWGTDHGKAAPMFVFGKGVNPGVTGTNPDLNNLQNGNIQMQYDYRQVFNEIVNDWFEATESERSSVNFDQTVALPKLNVLSSGETISTKEFFDSRFYLKSCFPNPVVDQTSIEFKINRGSEVTIKLYDSRGIYVEDILNEYKMPGEYLINYDASHLTQGAYFFTLKSGGFISTKKLIKE